MSGHWENVVELHFHGDRFEGGSLEVDVLPELTEYKSIVVAVAEALWWERHPARDRLQKRFRDTLQLRFRQVGEGSALTPLERKRSSGQTSMPFIADEFDEAIDLVNEALLVASAGSPLPDRFPKRALPTFGGWGKTLGAGEWVELRRPSESSGARFDHEQRARMLGFIEQSYDDMADQVGYVLATSVRKGRFELYEQLDARRAIEVPIPERFEATVLEAARDYETVRVRVQGRGAFDAQGQLLRFLEVSSIVVFGADASGEIDNSTLWGAMQLISGSVPAERWAEVPRDATTRLDEHLKRGIR
jgi:hypothetical protein